MNIHELVSELMRSRGVPSLAEFERRADLSPNVVYRWFRGETSPSFATLRRIEAAFGKRIEYNGTEYSLSGDAGNDVREDNQVDAGGDARDIAGSTSITAKEWYMRRISAPDWESLTEPQRENIERWFRSTQIEQDRIRMDAEAAINRIRMDADTAVKRLWMDLEVAILRGDPAGDCTSAR